MADLLAQVGMPGKEDEPETDRYKAVAKGIHLSRRTVSRICREPDTSIFDLKEKAMKRLEPSYYAYLYDSDSDSDLAQTIRTFLESRF